MYKWLIITIISIFVVIIVVRQCTDTETSDELSDTIIPEIDINDTLENEIDSENRKILDLNQIMIFLI